MLTKRIIPCLDIKDGKTVKGVNFVDLRDAGDPVELGVKYAELGADELVFLDITATVERRKTLVELVKRIALNINIPFTVFSLDVDDPQLIDAMKILGAKRRGEVDGFSQVMEGMGLMGGNLKNNDYSTDIS